MLIAALNLYFPPYLADPGNDEDKENLDVKRKWSWTAENAKITVAKIRDAIFRSHLKKSKTRTPPSTPTYEDLFVLYGKVELHRLIDAALEKLVESGQYTYVQGTRKQDFMIKIHNKAIRDEWLQKVNGKDQGWAQ